MWPLRRAALCVLLGAAAAAAAELGGATEGGEWPAPAWAQEDDECSAPGGCSLALLQLRAGRGTPANGSAAAAGGNESAGLRDAAAQQSGGGLASEAGGIPGGWGEAGTFGDNVRRFEAVAQGSSAKRSIANVNGTLGAGDVWGDLWRDWMDAWRKSTAQGGGGGGGASPVGGPSCARYGCQEGRHRSWSCQCNSKCSQYGNCCGDYWSRCHQGHSSPVPAPAGPPQAGAGILTLYHQTGWEAGPLILQHGFRCGRVGWCGGGIYFATTPAATNTKAIGPDSHKGYVIMAGVDVGRVRYMSSTCDAQMTADGLRGSGFDSISFNPGDGTEYVVYSPDRVLWTRHV